MSESHRETLLGYLSGALDENETRKVQQELECNESLQLECAALRKETRPLEKYAQWTEHVYQPPKGLAKRTCRRIWEQADGGWQTADGSMDEPSPISAKRHSPRLSGALRRNPKRGEWKSTNVIATICIGIMVLLLLVPTVQFVKNQIVQTVRQKTIKKIANNIAALSQIHEEIIFQQNTDRSGTTRTGGTDLGTFLASFGKTNLSQKTLDYFAVGQQKAGKFVVSPQSSASTLVGRYPIDSQTPNSSQYIQSFPFPQISHLFDPLATVSSHFTERMPGLTFAEWYRISAPVFAEGGGGKSGETLMNVSSEQNIIFNDGHVFFRKVGNK